MSGFGAATQAAGAAIQAYGTYVQGQAQGALLDVSARYARAQAKDARKIGRANAAAIRDQVAGILGGQRTSYAGENVMTDTGTPADLGADTARQGAVAELTALNNAARVAFGFQAQAASDSYQASLARFGGNVGAIGGLLGGVGSAINAA